MNPRTGIQTIAEKTEIWLSPALATASLTVQKHKDGTRVVIWNEDWDKEIFKDTLKVNPKNTLTHIHYFENASTGDTIDMTPEQTLHTLQKICSYLKPSEDRVALDTVIDFMRHVELPKE